MYKSSITMERVRRAVLKRVESHPPSRWRQYSMENTFGPEDVREVVGTAKSHPTMELTPQASRPHHRSPGIDRQVARDAVKSVSKNFPKEKRSMDPITNALFSGFESGLLKSAAPAQAVGKAVTEAAPVARTLASKLVDVMRKRPVLTAATAAAAGAGVASGAAQAEAKKKEEDRRREQVRQLLMSRLAEGGYVSG